MHDAALVRVRERAGHLAPDADRLLDGQPVVRAEPLPQRVALDVRHDVVELLRRRARIVDGEDVRMLQTGRELDLALEALRAERVRQLGVQDLDGDEPLVPHVVREEHRRRSAATDLPLQDVAPSTDIPLEDIVSGEHVVDGRR